MKALSPRVIAVPLVAAGLAVLTAVVLRAADSWVQVVSDGFGDSNNIQIAELFVFKGQMYAGGSRRATTGPAQLWRSADGGTWTQVTSFSPPLTSNQVAAIISFGDSGGTNPQFMYFGTNNANGTGSIYRSSDGSSWTQINGAGSGWISAGNGFISPHLVVKNGYLYAGSQNSSGAELWRRPVDDSQPWVRVIDFSTIDPTVTSITYLYAFNDVLYAGTGIFQGGSGTAHLYSSSTGDPGTWVKNGGVGNGFGTSANVAITSIVDYKGSLYLSTRNFSGGELYRSADLATWTRVASSGLGEAGNIELHNLRVMQNQIWISTLAKSPALFEVWRSSDGVNWTQSNDDGFGDANNTSTTGMTVGVTAEFGGSVYWGGSNEVTGAQIWRLQSFAPCEYSVTPSSVTFPASASDSSVSVTAQAGCTWIASSDAAWVTASPASGTGIGTVTLHASANAGAVARTATVTIGGRTVSVTQSGAVACTFAATPSSLSLPGAGGSLTIALTTQSGCSWSASADATWLSVMPSSGTGNATLTVSASANTTAAARTATVTVGGQAVTVTQPSFALPVVGPPAELHTTSVAGNVVTLAWTAGAGQLAPTDHLIEGGLTPGSVLGSLRTGSSATTFSFSAPSGVFYIRVKAVAGSNTSVASNEIRIFVNVPAPPSAPTNFVGSATGSALQLSWTNTSGGGTPSAIILRVTGSVTTTVPLPGTAQTFSHPSVPPGTYTFSVAAQNASGTSDPSNSVTLTFPGPCTAPQAPTNLQIAKSGNALTVTWDQPAAGPAPTSYTLIVSGAFVGSIPTTGRMLSGTVGAGSYTMSVTATNACGTSGPSAPQTITVP